MTEYCSICGNYSRDSCSYYYEGEALAEEIRKCGNLTDSFRLSALSSAGVDNDMDWELNRLRNDLSYAKEEIEVLKAEKEELEAELRELKDRLGISLYEHVKEPK